MHKCPDCKDTGVYVGFLEVKDCPTCKGGDAKYLKAAEYVFRHHVIVFDTQPLNAPAPKHRVSVDEQSDLYFLGFLDFPDGCEKVTVNVSSNFALMSGNFNTYFHLSPEDGYFFYLPKRWVKEEIERLGIPL